MNHVTQSHSKLTPIYLAITLQLMSSVSFAEHTQSMTSNIVSVTTHSDYQYHPPPHHRRERREDRLSRRVNELINDIRLSGTMCGAEYYGPRSPLLYNISLDTVAQKSLRRLRSRSAIRHSRRLNRIAFRKGYDGHVEEVRGEGYRSPRALVRRLVQNPQTCRQLMSRHTLDIGVEVQGRLRRGMPKNWSIVLGEPTDYPRRSRRQRHQPRIRRLYR